MKEGDDHEPGPSSTITALGFDVGLLVTAAVRTQGGVSKRFGLLMRDTICRRRGKKRVKITLEEAQDELIAWLDSPDMRAMAQGVDKVGVELHWSGPRPSGVQMRLRVLEYTIRQYYLERGIPVDMVWAATYKKYHGACRGAYAANKDLSRQVALKHVVRDLEDHAEIEEDRLHDLGDAYMVACKVSNHCLDLSK